MEVFVVQKADTDGGIETIIPSFQPNVAAAFVTRYKAYAA